MPGTPLTVRLRSAAPDLQGSCSASATSAALVAVTGLTPATVNKSLAHLERLGIVAELTNRQRGRVFSYARYVGELAAELA